MFAYRRPTITTSGRKSIIGVTSAAFPSVLVVGIVLITDPAAVTEMESRWIHCCRRAFIGPFNVRDHVRPALRFINLQPTIQKCDILQHQVECF